MAKFCSNCGAELKEGADVCLKCGKAVNSSTNVNTDPNAKSKIVAGLFGIFLGCFGVHNFYLGYKDKAIAQLLITVLTCGVLSVVSAIWGLIEGILILAGNISVDAAGYALKE